MTDINAAATLILNPTVVAALLLASIAVVTATATYTWTFLQGRQQYRSTRKRTIVAIYTEIELNLRDISDTLGATEWKTIARELEVKSIPIYIAYSRNMRFYERNHIETLDLPPRMLSAVVEFYAALNSVYAQLDGIQGPVFANISGTGRRQVLEDLAALTVKASASGTRALHEIEISLPYDWLHNKGAPLRSAL